MNNYRYTAIDSRGKRSEGSVPGGSIDEARRNVKKMGLKILDLTVEKNKSRKKINLSEINLTSPTVKPEALIRFFRQLATMLDAGIQLIDALEILEMQVKLQDKLFAKTITDVTRLVKSGIPFSAALKEHKNVFSTMVISMIKAAEVGGGLDNIINQIATFIEKEDDTKKKIKSATSYPKFVGGFFLVILTGIIFGLLPKFKEIFADLGAELPTPTRIILFTSDLISDNLIMIIIFGVAVYTGLKIYGKTIQGRLFLDRHIFDMPIAGNLFKRSILIRFTITLSILLHSGVGLIDALKIAAQTAENSYIDGITANMCERISGGESLGKMLNQHPEIFPPLEANMIAVGEKSGSLTLMLNKVAEFNDQEFSAKIENLSNVLEPVIMGVLGIIATILVLALYLAIFKMSSAIH